jgi:hypothetical protein
MTPALPTVRSSNIISYRMKKGYSLLRPPRPGLLPCLLLPSLLLAAASLSAGTVDHRMAFSRLPAQQELLYLPEKFAPCNECHPRAVAEDEDFNVGTNFRDTMLGKNLHWMHVFRQPQGTNCSACHRVDPETGRPGFRPSVRLTRSETGGTCAPACHRPKEYRNAGRGK